MAVKITQDNIAKILPEAHEIDARIKYLLDSQGGVINSADSIYGFPSIGKCNIIYKAENTKKLYQWNTTKLCYEELTISSTPNITRINGGLANTIFNDK